jgi:hypothetical protein
LTVSLESAFYKFPELGSERLFIEQVVNSQAGAGRLARVSWSDSFLGGTDRRTSEFDLLESVDDLVEIKDDVCSVRDEQTSIAVETYQQNRSVFVETRKNGEQATHLWRRGYRALERTQECELRHRFR